MIRKCFFIFVFIILLCQFPKIPFADYASALDAQGWRVVESKYFTILCHPEVKIERINSRIQVRFYDVDWGRYSPKNKTIDAQVADKFDRIFRKVEKILDMYPRKIHPVIKLFKNQSQLDKEYAQIFGSFDGKERISYYVHKYTTIYTTEAMISEGVLAHEIGHAVADHYFLILPPDKVGEMLSQFIELHLED